MVFTTLNSRGFCKRIESLLKKDIKFNELYDFRIFLEIADAYMPGSIEMVFFGLCLIYDRYCHASGLKDNATVFIPSNWCLRIVDMSPVMCS